MQIDQVVLGSSCMFGFQALITPAATAANLAAEQLFTPVGMPALQSTDVVDVSGPPPTNAVVIAGARANVNGQLGLTFLNPTAGALTFPAGIYQFCVYRR